ncbi:MauE/DoxX family redox-associated membrane protein [Micromonospora echinaurantiaca]|uniref:MauE/DoxX family redox-associated membrane protein n=1 Tax=Micromonospora echinaurantiaca TaxID=47857 RepID=UPI003798C84C
MSALVAGVGAYTVLLTLLLAAGEHLSKPAALSAALAAQRVVPAPSVVAAAVIAAEGLLGLAGVAALLRDGGPLLGLVLAGGAALFATYAGYGWYVRSTGRTVPCGCSRVEQPMTGWVVARAAVLAGLALTGSLLSGAVVPLGRPDTVLLIVLLAAATFTALLAHLPAAMHDPTPDQPPARVGRGGVPG